MSVSFQVTATVGTAGFEAVFTYQWRKDCTNITGATGPTLTISSAQPVDAGIYDVLVSNGCGTTTSEPTPLVVRTPATIIQQPESQSPCVGSSALLNVSASGDGPLTYQWRKNGTTIPGQTNSTLSLSSVSTNDSGSYSVVVSDGVCSIVSSEAQLTPLLPLSISVQPQRVGVCGSGSFTMVASITGSPPMSFQWRSNGVALLGATNISYNGLFGGGAAESYDVIASNFCGSVTSTVASVSRATPLPPLSEPASQAVCLNEPFAFCLCNFIFNNTNGGPVTFQWRKDGTNIPGARSFFYGRPHASTNHAGLYSCVVSNACGAVTSAIARLTVHLVSVSVVASTPDATEGALVPGVFTITRNQSQCADLRVFYSLSGTATNGLHYRLLNGIVTIPAGVVSNQVVVWPVDDLLALRDKTVELTLVANTNYQLAVAAQSATITLHDNDVVGFVVPNTVRVPEEGIATVAVMLNGPPVNAPGSGLPVRLAQSGGDTDLQTSGSTQFRIRQDQWNSPQFFSIVAHSDADSINGTATFTVSAEGLSNVVVTAIEIDRTGAPEIVSIVCLTNSAKELQVFGYPGSNYIIEATAWLTAPVMAIPWERIATNVADLNGLAQFPLRDAVAFPQRFFRARKP